jgi:cephalosporin hydroxylase
VTETFKSLSNEWMEESVRAKYSYNFSWMGRPIIQYPQDILALQELIWRIQPAAIVETGIAHGGSLVFSASMLELIGGGGRVLGIDIDIRAHNRAAIDAHPMRKRIDLIEGSSIDPSIVSQVWVWASDKGPVLVVLDSMHTHEHVLAELRHYSGLVTNGSYLVVLDTVIEDLDQNLYPDRPWAPGNSPKTAVAEFLSESDDFEIDSELENRLMITTAPSGFLRRVKS